MKKTISHFIYGLLVISLIACQPTETKKLEPLKIAISKAVPEMSYKNYVLWIHSADSTAVCLDMYHLGIDSALQVLKDCDALLLTGGEDIEPNRYGVEFDSLRCDLPDPYRDSLEYALIAKALELKMPIQGICRGEQILNTYFGGTLHLDIPTDIGTNTIHRFPNYKASSHKVNIEVNSILNNITKSTSGTVNSNHHQGVDKLAPRLKSIAKTEDGLTESVELIDTNGKAYLLGVQWHPEAMDYGNPLSYKIGAKFLQEAKKYQGKK
ncbi:MAG: gamma-glutamyl-gamma-aminobutyrate hydrolase family protein [Chlorobi bacterium]|nr:gamma-glutamyl-gamma-aminobutyrate hydrolase family protein [Chlorobiota bacterium]